MTLAGATWESGNGGYLTVRLVHVATIMPQHADRQTYLKKRVHLLHAGCSTPPVVYPNLIRNRRPESCLKISTWRHVGEVVLKKKNCMVGLSTLRSRFQSHTVLYSVCV